MIVNPEWISAAQYASKMTGFPYASVTLAQFIQETGWGQSIPPNTNNPFGIKQVPGLPSTPVKTREWIKGQLVPVTAMFAKFQSLQQAFLFHDQMFMRGDDYAPARAVLSSLTEFVQVMSKTYATDPNYSDDILHLITGYDLTQYDAPITANIGETTT